MVGPCYDLHVDGDPYRVLVLPMETGEPKQHRTVEQRTKDVLDAARVGFRQRNPHMKGVTFALRLAFGLPVDEDIEHIQFEDGSSAHLFEAYAMTNLLLCSAVDEGTAKSRSTGIMRKSCSRHMRATIDILQPTLVISQGTGLDKTLIDDPRSNPDGNQECGRLRPQRQPIRLGVTAASVAWELALTQVHLLARSCCPSHHRGTEPGARRTVTRLSLPVPKVRGLSPGLPK
jgi:hypothetical protein